jgi:hypothetical protein
MEAIVPPKRRFTYRLHGAISQKMATFITAALRTSDPTERREDNENVA